MKIDDMHFFNMGYLDIKIPDNLFQSLKNECYTTGYKNEEMVSAITGSGVPVHRYIENKENLQNLQDFLKTLVPIYKERYGLDPSDGIINRSINYENSVNKTKFIIHRPWINYHKKHEFIPKHNHLGVFSYTIWINIPYNSEDEIKQGNEYASCFQFHYTDTLGGTQKVTIRLNKNDAGRMLFFPSLLSHQVYPFYTSNETRISISGNLSINIGNTENL